MKITLTIPDSIYETLESRRGSVPRSRFIQDLIMGEDYGLNRPEDLYSDESMKKVFLNGTKPVLSYGQGKPFVGTIQNENSEKTKETQPIVGEDYSEIIAEINKVNDDGYHVEPSDTQRIKDMCKEKNVQYNSYKKTLERRVNGEWVIVARI